MQTTTRGMTVRKHYRFNFCSRMPNIADAYEKVLSFVLLGTKYRKRSTIDVLDMRWTYLYS